MRFFHVADVRRPAGEFYRITLCVFRCTARLDVREYVERRPGDPESAQPTEKGLNVPVDLIPRMRQALQEAEVTALADHDLTNWDYTRAGLAAPTLHAGV